MLHISVPRRSSMSRYPLAVTWALLLMSCTHAKERPSTSASGVVDARLVNGEGRCSGHLELKHLGQWRTLKLRYLGGGSFQSRFAAVACRQSGCGSVVSVKLNTNTTVPKPAWGVSFHCEGSEESIQQCRKEASRKKVDDTESSVSSIQVVCSDFLRVVDTYGFCSGNVMVKSEQNWFYICESESSTTATTSLFLGNMMCQELGCGAPTSATHVTLKSGVASKVIQCSGNESRLEECAASTENNCTSVLRVRCSSYSVRLVGGENRCRGVIEGKDEAEWRPLTGSYEFSQEPNLMLLCGELGCGSPLSSRSFYINERQPVWEMDYGCKYTSFCKQWSAYDSNRALEINCTESVKLEGRDRCTGFLKVKSDGSWRSLCKSQFTPQHAMVACRELGCGFPHEYNKWLSPKSENDTINIECSGQEERLVDCPASSLPAQDSRGVCDAAFVHCQTQPRTPTMTMFSRFAKEGNTRLTVYTGHRVLITCHIDLPFKVHTFKLDFYSLGHTNMSIQAAIDNTAHFLLDAAKPDQKGQYYCSYNFDFAPETFSKPASYSLEVKEASYARLVGESSRCWGRLEVQHQEEWRPVSQHQSWSLKEAAVVCRQLGCGNVIRMDTKTSLGVVQPVWRFYSDCDGSEKALLNCGTVKEWLSTTTIKVLCSDIVAPPNITVFADKPYKEDTDHVIVHEGHSFFINCSVEPQFPGGRFTLVFTGPKDLSLSKDAVNYTAIFTLSNINKAYSGTYSCIYCNTVSRHDFTFKSKTVTITVEESHDVMLDDGVQRDNNTSACSGKLLVKKKSSEMKMVTAETTGWDIRHASIVCTQLSCGDVLSTSKIELQNFESMWRFHSDCDGSEAALLECGHVEEWFSATAIQVVCAGKS